MNFDIRLLWLIGALGAAGCGFLVLIVRKAYPDYMGRVLVCWGTANLCLGAAYAIRFERAWTGQFIFNVMSCTLIVSCLSLEYLGVCLLKRQRPWTGLVIGLPLLVFAVSVWFTFAVRNITLELIACNIVALAMFILVAWTLLRTEDGRRPFADGVAAGAYCVMAIATFGVIVDALRSGKFSPEYDFNSPRAIFNGISAIVIEGVAFPVFLLMLSERLNRSLMDQAMRDSLTSLYNRRAFEEIAFREMAGAARTGMPVSLLILDLDHFKEVNDEFGHNAGDEVLSAAATILRSSLREEDFLCRWGGDEFCALLPRAAEEHAVQVAERIKQAFNESRIPLDGKTVGITASMGIVTDKEHLKDLSMLIKMADSAMYQAKHAGRNGYAIARIDALN